MDIVETFIRSGRLTREGYAELLAASRNREAAKSLQREAVRLQKATYGNRVYVRGLIEFTNYCKNNCHYCGIRGGNRNAVRYRLTREEILEYLCRIVRQQEQVDENFYELVLEREAYAQMDYGNYIAIPHPNRIASEESFAYVAVLEKPVVWNDLPVQVVLLVSIGRKEDQDMQRFYETTARFALNKEAVAAVIRNPEYQVFIEMLQR